MSHALASEDRWGTRLRAHSARASALYWQGQVAAALGELDQAAASESSFAGFLSYHLLSLASRLCEFGLPDPMRARALMSGAVHHAWRVRDPVFRQERIALTRDYGRWFDQAIPATEEVDDVLSSMTDADSRRAYKDLVSARWSHPRGARWDDLKRLVLLGLSDGTVLDTILGRLMGCRIHRHLVGIQPMADPELLELVSICSKNFTTSRPWEQVEPAVA